MLASIVSGLALTQRKHMIAPQYSLVMLLRQNNLPRSEDKVKKFLTVAMQTPMRADPAAVEESRREFIVQYGPAIPALWKKLDQAVGKDSPLRATYFTLESIAAARLAADVAGPAEAGAKKPKKKATVQQLKAELKTLGLDVKGKKAELQARLDKAKKVEVAPAAAEESVAVVPLEEPPAQPLAQQLAQQPAQPLAQPLAQPSPVPPPGAAAEEAAKAAPQCAAKAAKAVKAARRAQLLAELAELEAMEEPEEPPDATEDAPGAAAEAAAPAAAEEAPKEQAGGVKAAETAEQSEVVDLAGETSAEEEAVAKNDTSPPAADVPPAAVVPAADVPPAPAAKPAEPSPDQEYALAVSEHSGLVPGGGKVCDILVASGEFSSKIITLGHQVSVVGSRRPLLRGAMGTGSYFSFEDGENRVCIILSVLKLHGASGEFGVVCCPSSDFEEGTYVKGDTSKCRIAVLPLSMTAAMTADFKSMPHQGQFHRLRVLRARDTFRDKWLITTEAAAAATMRAAAQARQRKVNANAAQAEKQRKADAAAAATAMATACSKRKLSTATPGTDNKRRRKKGKTHRNRSEGGSSSSSSSSSSNPAPDHPVGVGTAFGMTPGQAAMVQLQTQQFMAFTQTFATNALAKGQHVLAHQTFNAAMALHASSIDVTAAAGMKKQ